MFLEKLNLLTAMGGSETSDLEKSRKGASLFVLGTSLHKENKLFY